MKDKHEYWTFEFAGDSAPITMGPIDIGRPVTQREIVAYIQRKYETTKAGKVYPHTPWWI